MRKIVQVAAATALLASTATAAAQGSGLCPGLSGAERTRCLEAEKRRTQRNVDTSNRRLGILNGAHKLACKADQYGREAAAGAGAVMGTVKGGPRGGVVGGVAGGAVYDGGRAIGRAGAGDDGCRR